MHAVPRPLEAPRVTILLPYREPGDTEARLIGALDLHGPSTDRIDAEATWTEWIDDLAQTVRTEVRNSVAFTTSLAPKEDLVVLAKEDVTFDVPGYGPWRLHGSKHQFNDTKHRMVDYAFRATTRFREYFPPTVMDDPDQRSILGAPKQISMPSTVRPPAPLIHSVLPLFRWEETTEPNQPFATRRRRRAGFRIYIERPWYASGEGELLGVLVAPAGNEMLIGNHASQWGSDPVWLQAGPKLRAIFFELTDLLHMTALDDRPVAARPVGPPALLPLREANGNLVQVLGYRPEFQPDRNKWFVDVAIDPGTAVWPFVRLAVTRYQPDWLPDCHLSQVVHCVFTQLTLERTATLSSPTSIMPASSSAARWVFVLRRISSHGGLPPIRLSSPSSSATTAACWRGWKNAIRRCRPISAGKPKWSPTSGGRLRSDRRRICLDGHAGPAGADRPSPPRQSRGLADHHRGMGSAGSRSVAVPRRHSWRRTDKGVAHRLCGSSRPVTGSEPVIARSHSA